MFVLLVARCALPIPALDAPVLLWSLPLKSHSFGSAAVADADGDGGLDVAFATYFGDATVRVLRGKDGSPIWSYHDPDPNRDDCYDASLRFADVNADGKLDLVVPCSSGCRVLCFDAATGTPHWNTPLGSGECTDSPPWIGDADGDGATDVVVGTFKAKLIVLRGSDGAIARTLEIADTGAVQTCPLALDANADGSLDFIAGIFARQAPDSLGLYCINGKDGSRLWRAPFPESVYHGPSIGRLAPDSPRLRIGTYDGKVYTIDPATGTIEQTVEPGERYYMSPTAMLDVEGDGLCETVAACEKVSLINADGTIRWSVPAATGFRPGAYEWVTRGASIGDLSGDGSADLAYLTSLGLLRVLDARTGQTLFEYDAGNACGQNKPLSNGSHGPVIADLTGDGKLDAFFVVGGGEMGSMYGAALCLTGFPGCGPGWTTIRHDAHNTGNAATPVAPSKDQ